VTCCRLSLCFHFYHQRTNLQLLTIVNPSTLSRRLID
jgi:hypothetical protein